MLVWSIASAYPVTRTEPTTMMNTMYLFEGECVL
jgi:hypothetical protein